LVDEEPEKLIIDFMDNLSCSSWKREGRDEAKEHLINYFIAHGYGQQHYTEEDLRLMLKEMDAVGMLFPKNSNNKLLDAYCNYGSKNGSANPAENSKRLKYSQTGSVHVISLTAAHRMIVNAHLLFTTVAPNSNQGVNRKPGCRRSRPQRRDTLVFGVLFVSFWTSKKKSRNTCNNNLNRQSITQPLTQKFISNKSIIKPREQKNE
ncbi:MAG: hypothetical protein GXC73_05990, partial [Chitinophagaceae bacterium]|nr:hypothetical protein [Chitinophagaceae bacterium]